MTTKAVSTRIVKELPLLFQTPMVKAILDDIKKVTRRTSGLNNINKNPGYWKFKGMHNGTAKFVNEYNFTNEQFIKCPYGQPGDILWVRENYRKYFHVDEDGFTNWDKEIVDYATDNVEPLPQVDGDGFRMYNKDGSDKYIAWRPPFLMPKRFARIYLEVTEVTLERLHDITDESAMLEGINKQFFVQRGISTPESMESFAMEDYHKKGFRLLWIDINGKESWDANPWVWVVSFKVLSTTGRPENLN